LGDLTDLPEGISMTIDLHGYPRSALGLWPTPLENVPRLSAALGGVYVLLKRDDLNGLGVGGNKLRKLEFLTGAALEDGADMVITFGALQTITAARRRPPARSSGSGASSC
jgi:D-cysteine desulfhydrase